MALALMTINRAVNEVPARIHEQLDEINRRLHRGEELESLVGSIRATLLVNFGAGMPHNHYGFSIEDGANVHSMMVNALRGLVNAQPSEAADLRRQRDEARPNASSWMSSSPRPAPRRRR